MDEADLSGWGDDDRVALARHRSVLTPPAGAAVLPRLASALLTPVGFVGSGEIGDMDRDEAIKLLAQGRRGSPNGIVVE